MVARSRRESSPTGLERLDQRGAHPVGDVGVEAAHARHLVAQAAFGEDVGDAVLGHPGPVAVPEPVGGQDSRTLRIPAASATV
jgi:hypothetical protein